VYFIDFSNSTISDLQNKLFTNINECWANIRRTFISNVREKFNMKVADSSIKKVYKIHSLIVFFLD
jgi:hypothetical protein